MIKTLRLGFKLGRFLRLSFLILPAYLKDG